MRGVPQQRKEGGSSRGVNSSKRGKICDGAHVARRLQWVNSGGGGSMNF
jgi:hypothetical protein